MFVPAWTFDVIPAHLPLLGKSAGVALFSGKLPAWLTCPLMHGSRAPCSCLKRAPLTTLRLRALLYRYVHLDIWSSSAIFSLSFFSLSSPPLLEFCYLHSHPSLQELIPLELFCSLHSFDWSIEDLKSLLFQPPQEEAQAGSRITFCPKSTSYPSEKTTTPITG